MPPSSELDRRAGQLLALMAAGALTCVAVGLGLRWLLGTVRAGEQFLALATALVVLAPLVSLMGVALGAMRHQRRLAWLALATVVVTLLGMGLAR